VIRDSTDHFTTRLKYRDLWIEFLSVIMGAYRLGDMIACISWPTNPPFSKEDLRAAADGIVRPT
jgi:hypothetical protein